MSVTMKELLEAGSHFGHQTRRWNPKMAKYIYGARNGIHIIDLQKTLKKFREAYAFIKDLAAKEKKILFIGTKKQAQELVTEEAKRCGMYYVNKRWLGGTLTNFQTIKKSISRLKKIELMKKDGIYDNLLKKETVKLDKELEKLQKFLGGIKDMNTLPNAVFIVDPRKEKIALAEANKLEIPVIGIVDTNCNPERIEFVIPANDDAIRSIRLFSSKVADAVIEGKDIAKAASDEREKAKEAEKKTVKKIENKASDVPLSEKKPKVRKKTSDAGKPSKTVKITETKKSETVKKPAAKIAVSAKKGEK